MRTANVVFFLMGIWLFHSGLDAAEKPAALTSKHWSVELEVTPCPGAGFAGASTLDGQRGQLVLWGGMVPPYRPSAELRRLSLASRKLAIIPVPGTAPDAVYVPSLALDAKRHVAYVFGGWAKGAERPSDGFVKLRLATDVPKWEPVKKTEPWPTGRNGACLVADQEGDSLVLFGGDGGPGPEGFTPLGDLWRYDLDRERWLRVQATGDVPPPRWHAMATIAPRARKLYLFGGAGLGKDGFDRRLYELDLKTWRWQVAKGNGDGPPSLQGATLTVDEQHGALVLVGGLRNEGQGLATSRDIWVYDQKGGSWERLEGGKGVQRRDHVAAYDPVGGLHYAVGGRVSQEVGNFYERGEPVESVIVLRLKRRGK